MPDKNPFPEDFGSVLPVQYFDPLKRRKFPDGEHRLLLAVLEDAVRCYLTDLNGGSLQQRLRFAEVRCWFFAPYDRRGLFAFESICALLEIDIEVFRRRLGSISLRDLPSRRMRWVGRVGARTVALRVDNTTSENDSLARLPACDISKGYRLDDYKGSE